MKNINQKTYYNIIFITVIVIFIICTIMTIKYRFDYTTLNNNLLEIRNTTPYNDDLYVSTRNDILAFENIYFRWKYSCIISFGVMYFIGLFKFARKRT